MTGTAFGKPVVSNALTNIVNSIPFPIFCKDKQHRFVSLNDVLCEYLGYTREQMIGKSDLDFFPKSQCDVFWALDDEVMRTEQISTIEEVITDAYGIVRRLRTKKGKLHMPDGEEFLIGISFVLDDETLMIAESEEENVFNAETLRSIEQLTSVCLKSRLSDTVTESYLNSLKVSTMSELFLHDKEFLQEFIDRIPYHTCYVDRATNIVCVNKRLKKFAGIDFHAHGAFPQTTGGLHELCEDLLNDKQFAGGQEICKPVQLQAIEYLICAGAIPIVGPTGILHGRLIVFDLLEIDQKKASITTIIKRVPCTTGMRRHWLSCEVVSILRHPPCLNFLTSILMSSK